MKNKRYHGRGFATVVAVVTVGLVGATVGGLMMRISTESRRAITETNQAQRRQLLLAGNLLAQQIKPSHTIAMRLPDILIQAGDSVILHADSTADVGKNAKR